MSEFAEWVRHRRAELGLTQGELAEFADVSRTTIKNIEADRGDPTASTVLAIQGAFHKAAGLTPPAETFAEEMTRRRIAAGLTRVQLATAAGIHRGTIANIEQGAHPPVAETVHAIREALAKAEAPPRPCACSAEVDELARELAEERIAHQQTLAVLRAIRALLDANGGGS